MSEVVLIKVTGPDHPGITSALSEVLADFDARILDVGQAEIHSVLSMGLLVHLPARREEAMAALEVAARALGVQLSHALVDPASYEDWVTQQGKPRHIITLLGRNVSARTLAAVSGCIASHGLNIDNIVRLSGRPSLAAPERTPYTVIEFSARGALEQGDTLKATFLELAQTHEVDIAFQADDIYRRNRRLIAFDMDSTLIQVEVINELASAAGVGEQVAEITEAAMRGELDFDGSFRKRLSLLEGLDESVLQGIADNLPLSEGAERLFAILRNLGFKTAIISGGFQYFGRHLQRKLGVDYVLANELEVVDGKVTGKVKGDIVNGERKAAFLREIAARENIDLRQVIAVGDGANDLPMIRIAGLGIAFRAKPVVRQSADHAMTVSGLDGILYLIGVRDRETLELLTKA